MHNYTIRLRHDGGIVAITTSASSQAAAVQQVLRAEAAPLSCVLNVYRHMVEGETLWNGAIATAQLAAAYNANQDHIHAWRALGREAPEQLLNGSHNLIASAPLNVKEEQNVL